jgi:hypothetical protein
MDLKMFFLITPFPICLLVVAFLFKTRPGRGQGRQFKVAAGKAGWAPKYT